MCRYDEPVVSTRMYNGFGGKYGGSVGNPEPVTDEFEEIKRRVRDLEATVRRLEGGGLDGQVDGREAGAGLISTNTSTAFPPASYSSPETPRQLLCKQFSVNGDDLIDIHSKTPSVPLFYAWTNNHGPLAWISIALKDPFTKPVARKVAGRRKKDPPFMPAFSSSKSVPKSRKDAEFRLRLLENSEVSELRPFSKDDGATNGAAETTDEGAAATTTQSSPESAPLEDSILKILPPRKAVWLYIDRFFLYVYPFYPYLDKQSLISDLEPIIGRRSTCDDNELLCCVRLRNSLDLAGMGTLLMVLRLSYLTLLNNYEKEQDFPEKTEHENYLLGHPIDARAVKMANVCMNRFHLLRRCPMNRFQCLLLMMEYQKLDGSDGFIDGSPHIFLGTLVQLAVSIGLNRDPESYDPPEESKRFRSLWRKIWYSMVFDDSVQSSMQGEPLLISHEFFDTRLPSFSEESANSDDMDVEFEAVNAVAARYRLSQEMNRVVSVVLNIQSLPTVGTLITLLDDLERYMRDSWTSLEAILTDNDGNHLKNLIKVRSLVLYLSVHSLLHPIYYHILLYYETKHNFGACLLLLEKQLKLVMEVASRFTDIAKHGYRYFGTGFDYYFTPTLETAIHKCIEIQISLYVRSAAVKKAITMGAIRAPVGLSDDIKNFMLRMMHQNFGECYIQGLIPVAERCFYAWRMMKATSLVFKTLQNDNLYDHLVPYNFLADISPDDLRHLYELTDVSGCLCAPERNSHEEGTATEKIGNQSRTTSLEPPPSHEVDRFWLEVIQQQRLDSNLGPSVNGHRDTDPVSLYQLATGNWDSQLSSDFDLTDLWDMDFGTEGCK
ncbi:DEKNAAC103787 [Brettanomyces naardenensis]|uniref:DEKNAAC103787 n=1 Tax=Brettanomyces naardenensis TaxID=13370 RepID=A0A448YPC8_BRENA|nr:DEKNAAC103787 [Brettanomyces naardenensis]